MCHLKRSRNKEELELNGHINYLVYADDVYLLNQDINIIRSKTEEA
jgi:hypothetical protein